MQPENETPTEPIQTQSQNNQTLNQAPEARKSSKAPWAVAAVASIVAIAGIAFGIYGMMKPAETANTDNLKVQIKNADGTTTTLETDKIETKDNESTIVITDTLDSAYDPSERLEVQEMVRKMHLFITENMKNHNVTNNNYSLTFDEQAVITIPGTEISTASDEAYGITGNSSTNNYPLSETEKNIMSESHKYAKSFLTDNGFNEATHPFWPENIYYYNPSTKTYCTVSENSLPFKVNCAKETWVTDSEKKLALELSKASEKINYVGTRNSKIVDSSVSPYQRVTASVGPAVGLFYRVSPNSEWQFFKGTQAEIECGEFTGDVAKAYAGTQCWDSSTNQESTVNPNN